MALLSETIERQRSAFRADPYPDIAARTRNLQALAAMLVGNRRRICRAVRDDFGTHPDAFTDLIEILGPAGRAGYAIECLEAWMRDDERPAEGGLFGDARAFVRYEPKGVVGNMAPWNFPFEIACGPVVEMLAAGNRVIIKPSDLAPACSELLAKLVADTFDPDHVAVSVGGIDLAKAFAAQPWDHLVYTGNPRVARQVAAAAAANLVPLTLELGGKCPAILTESGVTADAAETIVGTKLVKNGQMCIAVDYVLMPRHAVGDFVDLVRETPPFAGSGHAATDDCTGMITDRHVDRISAMLAEARQHGTELIELEPHPDAPEAERRLGLTLAIDPPRGLQMCREEIFGPILPIITYDSLDDALQAIDRNHRPLAIYIFGTDDSENDHILRTVRSGGACVNGCALQGAIPSLPFGGTGNSGYGRHHGIEGFREFSNLRGIVVRGSSDSTDILFPPYGEKIRSFLKSAVDE
ncbi:aldehyde dehydrogenase family protein [Parasphingopyxis sp.]|uniref:aldehyde dehydrogenase family protein n=1 Tax=Parasphingopyxis sp. TaxID=1920299 RepID=UPI003FA0BEC5